MIVIVSPSLNLAIVGVSAIFSIPVDFLRGSIGNSLLVGSTCCKVGRGIPLFLPFPLPFSPTNKIIKVDIK